MSTFPIDSDTEYGELLQLHTGLTTRLSGVGFAHEVLTCRNTDSTMRIAHERLGVSDCKDCFTTIAERQSAGKGRGAKKFISPTGGYYGTTVLRVVSPRIPVGIPLMVGVCVSQSLEELYGVKTLLKWPNDILSKGGEKLAGVLVELNQLQGRQYCYIGVGVNLLSSPSIAGRRTNSLLGLSGIKHTPVQFAECFLPVLLKSWNDLTRLGFTAFQKCWDTLAFGRGDFFTVLDGSFELVSGSCFSSLPNDTQSSPVLSGTVPTAREISGEMLGIDEQGFLLLLGEFGVVRILSGEVVFPSLG